MLLRVMLANVLTHAIKEYMLFFPHELPASSFELFINNSLYLKNLLNETDYPFHARTF